MPETRTEQKNRVFAGALVLTTERQPATAEIRLRGWSNVVTYRT